MLLTRIKKGRTSGGLQENPTTEKRSNSREEKGAESYSISTKRKRAYYGGCDGEPQGRSKKGGVAVTDKRKVTYARKSKWQRTRRPFKSALFMLNATREDQKKRRLGASSASGTMNSSRGGGPMKTWVRADLA